jgi:hypothetical protein
MFEVYFTQSELSITKDFTVYVDMRQGFGLTQDVTQQGIGRKEHAM